MVWSLFRRFAKPEVEVTFTATVRVQEEDPELTKARYAATAHAQLGDYTAAVADLERVHDLETADGSDADCFSEIRRAKYLQRAGQGDKAWQVFRSLLARHGKEPWTAIDLLDALRLHLQREGKAGEAIHYGVAHRLARVELYRAMKADAEAALAAQLKATVATALRG